MISKPPIFGNLSFSWRYAKIRNKSTVRFVKIWLEILYMCTRLHMCTMYVLTRHYSTSGISRISFRAQKHWCRLWNVLFEQFPSFWRCHAGVLVLLATHFKAGLQLIGNDLASFSSINPTGASTNTDRVLHHTLSVCTDRYYIPTKHTDRVYFSLFFQTGF